MTFAHYLSDSFNKMKEGVLPYLKNGNVLEFGSGLGGNLISIHNFVERGVGVDINRFYVRKANKLAYRTRANNIKFTKYDGKAESLKGNFDSIFSIGVFKRIPKEEVYKYVN